MANAKPSGPTNFPTKYHVLLWFSYVLTNNRQKRGVSGSIKSRASVPSCPNTISFCPLYLSRPSLSASYRVVPRGQLFLSLFFLFFLFFSKGNRVELEWKRGRFHRPSTMTTRSFVDVTLPSFLSSIEMVILLEFRSIWESDLARGGGWFTLRILFHETALPHARSCGKVRRKFWRPIEFLTWDFFFLFFFWKKRWHFRVVEQIRTNGSSCL